MFGKSQIDDVDRKISMLLGEKPIVYFVTDEVDFLDEFFVYSKSIHPMGYDDNGDLIEIDKEAYLNNKNYNSSSCDHWKSLYNINDGKLETIPQNEFCYIKNFDYHFYSGKSMEVALFNLLSSYITGYRNLGGRKAKNERKKNMLFLSGSSYVMPDGIAPFVEVIDIPYPYPKDIKRIMLKEKVITPSTYAAYEQFWEGIITSMKGFSFLQVQDVCRNCLNYYQRITEFDKNEFSKERKGIENFFSTAIKAQKEQILAKMKTLEFIDVPSSKISISGCENVVEYVEKRKKVYLNPEKQQAITPPKGILFAGVPGTGKSLLAKKIAQILDVPLIKMDMGSLMDKYLGESERKLRSALKLVQSVAPCILFIDEMDKAFSVKEGSNNDAAKNMLGYMLGWMQELTEPIFIYATANHIKELDSALLRSGRFDNKFFAFMPSREQCVDIFNNNIEARLLKMSPEQRRRIYYNGFAQLLDKYAQKGQFLTGGDIDNLVNTALTEWYFDTSRDFATVLDEAFDKLNSYGKTNLKDICTYWLVNRFNSFQSSGNNPNDRLYDFDIGRKEETADAKNKKPGSYFKKVEGGFESTYDELLYKAMVKTIDGIPKYEIRQ